MAPKHQDADSAIRDTDNDAALARLSAVKRGYLVDPFVNYFVQRAHLQPPRPPLINHGTFIRSAAIDDIVFQWLELSKQTGQKCQIVSLGAGSDTRFWRIATSDEHAVLAGYIELDFPEITTKKAMTIMKNKSLNSVFDPAQCTLSHGGTALHSPVYHLLPCDLRLPPTEGLGKLLTLPTTSPGDASIEPVLSPSLPTLLLFECVLAYMTPEASSAMLGWFIDYFRESGVLGCMVYEMFGLNDTFGRVMMNNLKSRNISLPGAEPYTTVESLKKRLHDVGFTTCNALTLRDIRRNYVDPKELVRVSQLEMLDEVEELDLILGHYAVSWGLERGKEERWAGWGLKKKDDVI
ncbi:hypothetical protein AMATHDRAFT_79885 [Amanita thiersii Skay4041]|uniref:Leucine carboxyl methyltransferase 1 n=1 Tax=Amanita thiersii Skay4041 TaxID=703135 RepID=A0A2A9NV53_9AGAR|nr:hypothetical protein AMATHDRAFT_79885 [Amanita thiersii Skay4041]